MKKLFTILLVFLTLTTFAQIPLYFSPPSVDTGVGVNRVVTYTNVATVQGQSLDVIVCVNEYYTSAVFDTLWHPSLHFTAVAGAFRLHLPHLDTFNRQVGLSFKFVVSGTNICFPLDISARFFDLDATNKKVEYIIIAGNSGFSYNPSYIAGANYGSHVTFTGLQNINPNNFPASVNVNYTDTCGFTVIFGVQSYVNGGNTKYYIRMTVEEVFTLALGDVVLTSFQGDNEGCINYVDWVVAEEANLINYELEYSSDGIHFYHLDYITPDDRGYYYYPVAISSDNNYYRLKMNYTDGDYEYSKVIFVESSCVGNTLKVFPNPTSSGVNVVSDKEIRLIEVFNILGQKLQNIPISSQEKIYLDLLPVQFSQIYVKIEYKDGSGDILKIVKYL